MNERVRIKVTDAARLLEMGADTLRLGIQNHDYDEFAVASKTSSRFTYVIIRKKFYEYIGKEMEPCE